MSAPSGDACPLCGGALRPWRRLAAADPTIPGTYDVLRCASCGAGRTVGEPPEAVYEHGTYATAAPRGRRLVDRLLGAFAREKVRVLRAALPGGGSVLDVGAGKGRFVAAAAAAGYAAEGLEPSQRLAAVAEAAGVRIRRCGLDEADVAPGSVDAVTLWHVLEHLDDPAGAVERIAGWVRPGGALVVAVPNLSSVQARIGGASWFHLDVPRHRTHFTLRALRRLLEDHGFEVVAVRHVLLEHNPYGMWQTWVNRVSGAPGYLYNLLKRNVGLRPRALVTTLALLPLVPVAALAELLAGAAGRGGTVAITGRRRPAR